MLNVETIVDGLDQGKLMRSLGARRRTKKISAGLMRRLTYWQAKLPLLLAPRISHRTIAIEGSIDGCIHLPDGACFNSPKLTRTLAEATQMCCFVATIGPGVPVAVNSCMAENRHRDAFILDTLGSMAAEALIDSFHKQREREFRSRGQGVTLRFSPGYCDWDISDQIHLFSLFQDEHPAGVELTETCLMSPCKSVSGVFGILPVDSGSSLEKYNPCKSCGQRGCRGRRL